MMTTMPKRHPLDPATYQTVMDRDRFCQASRFGATTVCQGALIVHHRKVKGMGGSADPSINDPENLIVLCGGLTGSDGHHGWVHSNPSLSYDNGLLIRHST